MVKESFSYCIGTYEGQRPLVTVKLLDGRYSFFRDTDTYALVVLLYSIVRFFVIVLLKENEPEAVKLFDRSYVFKLGFTDERINYLVEFLHLALTFSTPYPGMSYPYAKSGKREL